MSSPRSGILTTGKDFRGESCFCFAVCPKYYTFAMLYYGTLAEWLGTGLQNLLRRFESARYLENPAIAGFFYGIDRRVCGNHYL